MKLKILVNGFDARQALIIGFANAGYPVCAVEGDTPIYVSGEYYIVVELPDDCLIREGERVLSVKPPCPIKRDEFLGTPAADYADCPEYCSECKYEPMRGEGE